MAGLGPVKWNGADAESPDFDGFADGETWNGFDVIYVTPEQRDAVYAHWFSDEMVCCAHPRSDHHEHDTGRRIGDFVITSDPECAQCDCLMFDDGAANITDQEPIKDGPYAGLISLLGYCTVIVREVTE